MELGGIVADFLFRNMRIVLAVQGPTHQTPLRIKKDVEQDSALAEMGYTSYPIEEDLIYDAGRLDRKMKTIFLWRSGQGSAVDEGIGRGDLLRIETQLRNLESAVVKSGALNA